MQLQLNTKIGSTTHFPLRSIRIHIHPYRWTGRTVRPLLVVTGTTRGIRGCFRLIDLRLSVGVGWTSFKRGIVENLNLRFVQTLHLSSVFLIILHFLPSPNCLLTHLPYLLPLCPAQSCQSQATTARTFTGESLSYGSCNGVEANLAESTEQWKKYYAGHLKAVVKFSIGQQVLLNNAVTGKLDPRWTGPWEVMG